MEDYLPKVILTEPYRSLELVTNGDSPFDRKVSWMFWSGGREGAQQAAMGGRRVSNQLVLLHSTSTSDAIYCPPARPLWHRRRKIDHHE